MRVLVSGAGVAGMTFAYWLHRNGDTPVIVERSSPARRAGYGIDFGGTGYDVAARMGIAERLSSRQLPVESVAFVDAFGRTIAAMDRALVDKIASGPHLGLMHGTLEEAIAEAIAPNVGVRYGQTITAIRQEARFAQVTLADGSEERYDAIVGADGVHSHTRGLVFGPENGFARHLGYQIASHPVVDRFALGAIRVHYTEPGRQIVLYPTGRPDELIALYLFRSDVTTTIPRDQRGDRLREVFGGMGWLTPRVLDQLPDPHSIFMDTLTQIVMPTWHRGRVVLIGDACGCTTLASAQGVSMAMAGGYLLAQQLKTHRGDLPNAFAAYQESLRPHVRHRQRNARWFAHGLVPATRTGLKLQNIVSPIIMHDAFVGLLRQQFGAATILPDVHRSETGSRP